MRLLITGLAALSLLFGTAYAQSKPAKLTMEVYNPGDKSIFPVSSEIIIGNKDVMLIDAQFQRNDAQILVDKIKATGKNLTTIYISQSDPDFYFGLETLHKAFPEAKILATQATIDLINQTKKEKLAFWGPKLGENAPKEIIVPSPVKGKTLHLEGNRLEIKGVSPSRTFLWVPGVKAVVGGVLVDGDNIHPWVADTQTQAERKQWLTSLEQIAWLKPEWVVPGHFLPGASQSLESVNTTKKYLLRLEKELPKAKDSKALIAAMKAAYPNLKGDSSLELSAKVLKGEMKWPQ